MKHNFRKGALGGGLATVMATSMLALTASGAYAQEETAAADEVIFVTGTRIARPDLQAASPIAVVSPESLRAVGTSNVEEFLRDLPQVVPAQGGNSNNGNDGVATIDLRNLGEERTLVLVDGKRFVGFDAQGIVDLNMIPTALIKRVELVTGGASAVYGSDAIAGVVNFVMRDDFEGLEADAQFGITEKGDGARQDYSLTFGMNSANDRGNIVLNFGYTDQNTVTQGDRSFSEFALAAADFGPGGSFTTAGGFVDIGDGFQFDSNGVLTPDADNPDRFNFNPFNLLQAPQNKWTATAIANYDLTDDIGAFGRFSFANSQVTTVIAPTGTFFFPFQVNYLTNPFIADESRSVFEAADADGDGTADFSYGRRLTELGTRDSIYENTAYQAVLGLDGEFGDSFNWEVFGQYARTNRTITFANDVGFDRTQQGILVVDNGNGPECIDTSGSCVPVNIFGPGNLTTEAGDFIRLNLQQNDKTDQIVLGGNIGGDLPFAFPGTDVPGGFVVGVEYRQEQGEARPDDNLVQGNSIGFGSRTPIDAEYTVREIYGEINIPLVTDKAFAESLSIEAGVRYSDYSNTINGVDNNDYSNTSWKIGAQWTPISDVRFRGSFQRAVRAPNLAEIGEPRTPSTGDANVDPCQGSNPIGNATLEALCLATGVPTANLGSVGGPISGQINNFIGGNPDLVPEISETFTVGAVIQPSAIEGLTMTIDYFDIKVEDAILQIPEQSVLDICYFSEQDANGDFCSLIDRNPLNGRLIGGTETGVDVRLQNIGFLRARGIDLTANYGVDLGNKGELNFNLNLTRQLKSDLQFADQLEVNECVGTVGTICLSPDPKWRWIQTTVWTFGDFTTQLRWQRIGGLTNDSVARGEALPIDFVEPTIGSFNYFDLSTSYQATDFLGIRAGINNLTDKKPPVVGNDYGGTLENSGNTYPATYDPLGRSFFVGATLTF